MINQDNKAHQSILRLPKDIEHQKVSWNVILLKTSKVIPAKNTKPHTLPESC